ncbi:MAG: adenine nucleotide alpha hydrolase [Gracilibacter sp. BRH_c7a]|nr:MAG: adenine nucleotide alpha hydrolase [Gracilibacter sp. BRH_c7a]
MREIEYYKKLDVLKHNLSRMEKVIIAFSGGVDSTFLLHVAYNVLGDNAIPVTVNSTIYPVRELNISVDFCRRIRLPQHIINFSELDNPKFCQNPPERCYICKKELFGRIKSLATQLDVQHIVDGSNLDDIDDYRPGMQALNELGIKSPLIDASLTKEDIRELSQEFGLPTWDKPSFACLVSRIPYGQEITKEKLSMIDKAEQYLLNLGFKQVRVRHHGEIARIEVAPEERCRFTDVAFMDKVADELKLLGFTYVVLDLRGYRSGSMNETLKI